MTILERPRREKSPDPEMIIVYIQHCSTFLHKIRRKTPRKSDNFVTWPWILPSSVTSQCVVAWICKNLEFKKMQMMKTTSLFAIFCSSHSAADGAKSRVKKLTSEVAASSRQNHPQHISLKYQMLSAFP